MASIESLITFNQKPLRLSALARDLRARYPGTEIGRESWNLFITSGFSFSSGLRVCIWGS
jgi:hypothetical protein